MCVWRFRSLRRHRSFGSTDTPEGVTADDLGTEDMDDISFFSADDRCAAWHFRASGDAFTGRGGRPCVVMAPGFASTRDTGGLVAYAKGFAAAGLDVVLFDYRGFAASGGSPRQLVWASRQRQDYRAAIAAARRLPGIDPERIVLWGISNSGGHVVRVGAEDRRVAAVVSVTPAVDGVAVVRAARP